MDKSNLSIELVERLREEPSLFVEKILEVDTVYDYQKEFLDSGHDRKAIVGGRQVGKTTMMAWLAIHEFTMWPNRKILLVAPTKRQAKNFMSKLRAEISEWLNNEDEYGLSEVMKMRLEGVNGSWIQAVPALDETIRGLTIDSIFVDEAAFIERQIFTSVLSPMLATTDGQFVIGSTPWGKEGYLFNKFDDDEYWETYQIPSMRSPAIEPRQIDEWRRDMTDLEFEREVLGQFSEKKNAFFKNKDINRCLEWQAELKDGQNIVYPDREVRECFMGVDPATQGEDSAVITSIDTEGNVFDIKSFGQCEIPELEGEIRNLITRPERNYIGGFIEENGVGEGTVHRFEKEFGHIQGFRSTIRSKESIYQQAKNQMQSGRINMPDHETLKSQLRTMEYEMTQRGNKKIHAPGDEHDDFADSFVLSIAALNGNAHVERQKRAYSITSSNSNHSEKMKEKRAFSF